MKRQRQNLLQKGFTIIEVMIVLAIAGVILLMVFLAIPALQRNNRNTQIRNDVASLLGLVNEYSSNHNGALPTSVCYDANGNIGMNSVAACSATTNKAGQIRAGITVSLSATAPTTGTTGAVAIAVNKKCNGTVLDSGTNQRAFAALFNVETASSTAPQCQDS